MREKVDAGTGGSAISVPEGGGAIRGMGETFQPNVFMGTGNFSVPIATSPGRSGFGPGLSLQYSTGNGNGCFGMGWQLSVPRISRKTEKGLPLYGGKDIFVMSGAEDLVPKFEDGTSNVDQVSWPGYSVYRYRPRNEGLFARIEKWVRDDGDVHWRATTKENVTSIYGRNASARVHHPDEEDRIYEWLLEETFDARGNHMLYEYAQDDANLSISELAERNRLYCQRYLRRIYYGNYPEAPGNAVLKYRPGGANDVGILRAGIDHLDQVSVINRRYAMEVVFDYGDWDTVDWDHVKAWDTANVDERENDIAYADHGLLAGDAAGNSEKFWHYEGTEPAPEGRTKVPVRVDRFSSFRAGFEVRTMRLCRRVLMYHHFFELGQPTLVKATNFLYEENKDNRLSFLRKVISTGYRFDDRRGKYVQRAMPAVAFDYSVFEPEKRRYEAIEAIDGQLPPGSLKDANYALADVIGDGLPDVVESRPEGFRYWRNLGGGRLDRPRFMKESPAGFGLADKGVAFGDMSGDGKVDLLVHQGAVQGFFEISSGGEWSTRSFRHYHEVPTYAFGDPDVRMVDLTGDGLSDMLVTGDREFIWFRGDGENGFTEQRRTIRQRDLDKFPDVYFSDPAGRVRLADMTGDGLNDIVLLHDGRVDYWPNLGYGKFGKRLTMERAPRIGADFDPARLFLVDLDGSGVADLVYVDFDEVRFWFNCGGNSWSKDRVICGTPPTTGMTGVQFGDFFGNGTACLIWSYDRELYPGSNYKVLDFSGGVKPYLLTGMDNHLGAVTRVRYASSTKFYLEDEALPETRWLTRLPFPVQVLEKTETIDLVGKSKLVTNYRYHHGYFEGREREFRGFARVDQIDTESFDEFSAPGLVDAEITNASRAYHTSATITRNWFHTGFYYDEDRADLDGRQFYERLRDKEFYRGDSAAFELPPHAVAISDRPHEAYRALRGALLRSEVYSFDGSDREVHPFQVVDQVHGVREVQPAGGNPYGVFLRIPRETVTWNYERSPDDPRITHTIAARVDAFGEVTDEVSIAYPRRGGATHAEEQQKLWATYVWNRFVHRDDTKEFYYVARPCEARLFEIKQGPSGWGGDRLLNRDDFSSMLVDYSDPSDHRFHHFEERSASFHLRLLKWSQTYYRKDGSPGAVDGPGNYGHRLKLGEIGRFGLPYETYRVVFTKKMLVDLYDGKVDHALLDEAGYVRSAVLDTGDPYWPVGVNGVDDYWWAPSGKQAFAEEGFLLPTKTQDPFGNQGTMEYDSVTQGGQRFDIFLFPVKALDAEGNVTIAEPDYRVLQPFRVTDPNLAVTEVAFDALGLTVATGIRGNQGEGDLLYRASDPKMLNDLEPDPKLSEIAAFAASPKVEGHGMLRKATTRTIYDVHAFADGRTSDPSTVAPAYSAKISRNTHDAELRNSTNATLRLQLGFTYVDGFGRLLQTKTLAAPKAGNERWLSTGAVVLNNKGNPVKRYEPFYSANQGFGFDGFETNGASATLFYDPLGRVVGTLFPNHTYEKVVFDAWRQESWDANDTLHHQSRYDPTTAVLPDHTVDPTSDPDVGHFFQALSTGDYLPTWYDLRMDPAKAAQKWPDPQERAAETGAAQRAGQHAATPSVSHLDSLGRTFRMVGDNGDDASGAAVLLETHVTLDVEGLELKVRDARGIEAFLHVYDMGGLRGRVDSVDAGTKQSLADVGGKSMASWDANDHETRLLFDRLRRVRELWVNKDRSSSGEFVLVEKIIYGEQKPNAHLTYHRGQVWKSYDGAGLVENVGFDFKGNTQEARRRLLLDGTAEVEWAKSTSPHSHTFDASSASALLDSSLEFTSSTQFDAHNRVTQNLTPDGTIQQPRYDEAGLLTRLLVSKRGTGAPQEFVKAIHYNARGQRDEITFGNGVTTAYTYDVDNFRLVNLHTRRGGSNQIKDLQDLSYVYDPVGNIAGIRDDAHEKHFNHGNVIEPISTYTYDPLYRLTEATGREHESMSPCHYQNVSDKNTEYIPMTNQPVSNGKALCKYTEKYAYDPAGNLTTIDHLNRTKNVRKKRNQTFAAGGNQILTSRAGCSGEGAFSFGHDGNGNLQDMAHLPDLKWDFKNQLVEAQLNKGANPNRAYYQYDAQGRRIRKTVVKNGGARVEQRLYLGGYEMYTVSNGSGTTLRRDTVHVMDDKARIALIEEEKDPAQPYTLQSSRVRYQHSNHLGSATVELDDSANANLISYEEYYPYGGTSYLAGRDRAEASRKRYRYSGKERDDETGLYYYGARYYAPWMGRWISCDPIGPTDGLNLYMALKGNPTTLVDLVGFSSEESFADVDVSELNDPKTDLKHDLNDNRTPAQRSSTPMSRESARRYGNVQADRERRRSGSNTQGVQMGHTAAARHAPESGISKADWDKQPFQHLHSRKDQGFNAEVTDNRSGVTKSTTRHRAQEQIIDQSVDNSRRGGTLTPQGQLDAADEVAWRTENTPMDHREVERLQSGGTARASTVDANIDPDTGRVVPGAKTDAARQRAASIKPRPVKPDTSTIKKVLDSKVTRVVAGEVLDKALGKLDVVNTTATVGSHLEKGEVGAAALEIASQHPVVGAGVAGWEIGRAADKEYGLGETALTWWGDKAADLYDLYYEKRYGN